MSLRHQWSPPQWCTWSAPQADGITTLRQNPLVSHLRASQSSHVSYQAAPPETTVPARASYSVIQAPPIPFHHPTTYAENIYVTRPAAPPRAETVNLPVAAPSAEPPKAEATPRRVAFGPETGGPKREVLRALDSQLPFALLIRLDDNTFVGFQCSGTDSHDLLTERCEAFIAHHSLNKVIAEGIIQKALTMMRKQESLLKKRMLGQIKTATETVQYSVIDILSLM